MVQLLLRTVWKFLKKIQIELPYDPAIPLLYIHIKKKEKSWFEKIHVSQYLKQHYFLMIFIFSVILDVQYSDDFYCTAKWPSHISFSHITLHHVPSKGTRYSSLCYTAGSHCLSLQMQQFGSINPRFQVHPTPSPSPLSTTSLFSKSMSFFSVESFLCAIYQIPYVSDVIQYLSFSF